MTPSGRAVSPLDSLAPDQRAALELVVRQGRSYSQLASRLGIPEDAVRDRARSALEALAPDLPPPAGAGELADFLLGQLGPEAAERTRARLAGDAAAQRWVMTVGAPLGELAPEPPPAEANAAAGAAAAAGDPAAIEDVELPEPRPAARPRAARRAEPAPAPTSPPAPRARSSRLGGAILLGAAVLLVAAALIFVLTRHGDGNRSAASPAASPTPTATAATDQLSPNDVVMRGPAGSRAVGLMRLFTTSDDNVHFLLAGQSLPANRQGERYALWFLKHGAAPRRLGYAKFTVGKDGALAMTGPAKNQLKAFPTWFTSYDTVAVTDDGAQPRSRPGAVVLAGSLPKSGG